MNRNVPRGPLINDHLQDLEMEIELLRRKRQLIEQQQQMLTTERQFQKKRRYNNYNNYDKPRQMYNSYDQLQQSNSNHDFSYLYDDKSGPTPKKQNRNMPAKYISGPQKGNRKKGPQFRQDQRPNIGQRSQTIKTQQGVDSVSNIDDHPQSVSSNIKPLLSLKTKPSLQATRAGVTNRKDFKPTKVTKPKLASPPNKLNSYSTAERKALINEASTLASGAGKNPFVLYADIEPSVQVNGRLELALGRIIKDIKEKYSELKPSLFNLQSTYLRMMKQAIRERIRSVMIGKIVGNVGEIIDNYRVVFPKETDEEIVQLAVDAEQSRKKSKVPIEIKDTDNAKRYFENNMHRLLRLRLDEMFSKLQKLYENENNSNTVQEIIHCLEEKKDDKPTDLDEPNEPKSTTEEDTNNDSLVNNSSQSLKDNNQQVGTAEINNDISKINDVKEGGTSKNKSVDVEKAKYYDTLIETLLNNKLPQILPNYRKHIIKILDIDQIYTSSKSSIIDNIEKNEISENNGECAQTTQNVELASHAVLHYVKILSRPHLPNKKIMQSFLNDFNPTTIKKHKYKHNLLFVGFVNKEDFHNILAANGSVVGNSKLRIEVSERKPAKTEEQNLESKHTEKLNDSDVQIIEDDNVTINLDSETEKSVISHELDIQITDLLSSIREAEEQKGDEGEVEIIDNILQTMDEKVENVTENTEDVTKDSSDDKSQNDDLTSCDVQETVETVVKNEINEEEPNKGEQN